MRRADRLFRLVQLLRQRRFATADQLAQALGVSRRTVYRDIRDLQDSDVPIRGEAGVGYALERGFELPPLTFTTAEIEALVLGARMVQAWADPELAQAAQRVVHKVEAVVPAPMRAVLADTPLFAIQLGGSDATEERLGQLRRAVADRRWVSFAYVRRDGAQSQRRVRPLGLYFWGRSWTLTSWDPLREDYRSFRPDRMDGLVVEEEQYPEEEGISLQGFLERMGQEEGPSGALRVRGR